MPQPVSLIGHNHVCPQVAPRPHIGGPVITGQTAVRVDGIPVAVVGDKTICTGVPCTDAIVRGSRVARINGKAVARLGDPTSHGGRLVAGSGAVRSD